MGKQNEHGCKFNLFMSVFDIIAEQEKEIQSAQDRILELAQGCQEYREQQVKQAQIDVLNKLKKKYGFYSCYSWNCDTKSLNEIIDEFIKEVQNAEDKG